MSVIVGLVYSIAVGILVPINILSEKKWARSCSLLGIILFICLRIALEM